MNRTPPTTTSDAAGADGLVALADLVGAVGVDLVGVGADLGCVAAEGGADGVGGGVGGGHCC